VTDTINGRGCRSIYGIAMQHALEFRERIQNNKYLRNFNRREHRDRRGRNEMGL
jgi:hypothetical protein